MARLRNSGPASWCAFVALVEFVADVLLERLDRRAVTPKLWFMVNDHPFKLPNIPPPVPLVRLQPLSHRAIQITWFSSTSVFTHRVYEFELLEPPVGPKDPLIPITANRRDIHPLTEFVDTTFNTSRFATKFELALKKAIPVLGSDSGTLWNPRTVRGKKPEL